jgi:peptidyl-dipeptidase Dcp
MYRTLIVIALAGAALGACSKSHSSRTTSEASAPTAASAGRTMAATSPITGARSTAATTRPMNAGAAGSVAMGTSVAAANVATGPNPLLAPSPLSYHAPEFDKIRASDFKPAIEKGMAKQLQEVDAIANNPAPPTFRNTLVALEQSGRNLNRAMMVFGLLTSADTNPTLQKVQAEEAPKLAAHHDAIFLNQKLWQRVKTVYKKRKKLDLDHADQRLIWYYHQQFVHAGANLSASDRAKLKKLNEKAASLSTTFNHKLLAATKEGALVVSEKSKLDGLSDSQIKAAAALGKKRGLEGKYVIALQNTTQQPDLAELTNRDVRHTLFENSWNRAVKGGKNDTRSTISHLAKVRAEKAKLLGYPNFAAWKLVTQMAKNPKTVDTFLAKIVGPSKKTAENEAGELQQLIDQNSKKFKLTPWDWEFYAQKLRQKKYQLDANKIKPYFEINDVLKNGVFYAANQLYGITFKERHDLPVWAPDVHAYEVYDKDGSPLALFYTDYYKRDNKGGGAWMSNLVEQSKLLGTLPVIYNVANFPPPSSGEPELLTLDDVITMFHEFGHALNGFFADEEYPSLSGAATPRDFVEYPSQFNEHWALYPKVFNHYAVHYKSGKPMPKALRKKMMKAQFFNSGYDMTELVAAAELDMQWHELPASAPLQKPEKFGPKALKKTGIYMKQVPSRYRSSYFEHIWNEGYAAGYYAYMWTQMLCDDSYQWFLDHGGLTRKNGQRYRDLILARGNSVDPAKMFREFYGGKPKIGPFLKYRGISGSSAPAEVSAKSAAAGAQ